MRDTEILRGLRDLLRDHRILIAGYGREGRSSERLLKQLLPEAPYVVAQNDEEIAAALEKERFDLILKSPGIPTMHLEGRCDLDTVSSQTDLMLRVMAPQVVGVTGTKGKSTTTNLLAHLLREGNRKVVMAGNMGIPLFDIAEELDEDSLLVCELSCHQLENIHRAPHVGVVLNLFQEHLDHYHDYMDYQMAKMQMLLRQQPGDAFFYCQDNADLCDRVASCGEKSGATRIAYSLEAARTGRWASAPRQLMGDHNLLNVHVAAEMASWLGVGEEAIVRGIASFKGLDHRLQQVDTFNGVTYYNDSICTIPEACIQAVRALQRVDTLILGGFDRGIDYSGLVDFLRGEGSSVRNLALVGKAGHRIAQAMGDGLRRRHVLMCDNYPQIVEWCAMATARGKICLLSPAAASYDAFKNFEERGSLFMELVRAHYARTEASDMDSRASDSPSL